MNKKRILALLLNIFLLAGVCNTLVLAEEGMSVVKTVIFAGKGQEPVITNGAEGISVTAGRIHFALAEGQEADPATLDANIQMKKTVTNEPVACGASMTENNTVIAVKFGRLNPETQYTITLGEGIKSPNGDRKLTQTSLTFTTGKAKDEFFSEEFKDYETGPLAREDVPGPAAPAEGGFYFPKLDEPAAFEIRESADKNKYLYVKTGDDPSKGRVDGSYSFPNKGIPTGFVFDLKLMLEEWGTQVNVAPIDGNKWLSAFRIQPGTDFRFEGNYKSETSNTDFPSFIKSSEINKEKFFNLRIVYRLNSNGVFVVDGYIDRGDGKGYQLVVDGMRAAKLEKDLATKITVMRIFSMNGMKEKVSAAGFDDISLSHHMPVQLLYSNIYNNQVNVDTDTRRVTLRFSEDMRADTFAGNIKLVNTATNVSVNLLGKYNGESDTYAFTAEIPEGALEADSSYEIQIGKVISSRGFRYDDISAIAFNTGAGNPVEISGDIIFTDKPVGGSVVQTLSGTTAIYPKIKVKKNIPGDAAVDVVIALYDETGRLQRTEVERVDLTGVTEINGIGMENIESKTGWTAKAFVLDSLHGLTPMTSKIAQIGDTLSPSVELMAFEPWQNKQNLNIVYLGGSITQGAQVSDGKKSWVGRVSSMFNQAFPNTKINHYNAGVGGTGSDLGLMRLTNDVISKKPDLVFVEFAVNDQVLTADESQRYMEGIVRNLLEMPNPPMIVFVYTTTAQWAARVEAHEEIAQYYGIPSINLQQYMYEKVQAGEIKTEEFLGDGTHPNDNGYFLYGEYIISCLNQPDKYLKHIELKEKPFRADYYKRAGEKMFPAEAVKSGGWVSDGSSYLSNTPGDTMTFTFTGPYVGIMHRIGSSYGQVEVRIDGNIMNVTRGNNTTPYLDCYYNTTSQPVMWYKNMTLADGEQHTLELKILDSKNPSATDTKAQIDYIYVAAE